jgi:hypothetical protein
MYYKSMIPFTTNYGNGACQCNFKNCARQREQCFPLIKTQTITVCNQLQAANAQVDNVLQVGSSDTVGTLQVGLPSLPGNFILYGTLTIDGTVALEGNVTIGCGTPTGNLTVCGTSTLQGAVTAGSTLAVAGAATFSGASTFSILSTFSAGLKLSGTPVQAPAIFDVAGVLTYGGLLQIISTANFPMGAATVITPGTASDQSGSLTQVGTNFTALNSVPGIYYFSFFANYAFNTGGALITQISLVNTTTSTGLTYTSAQYEANAILNSNFALNRLVNLPISQSVSVTAGLGAGDGNATINVGAVFTVWQMG